VPPCFRLLKLTNKTCEDGAAYSSITFIPSFTRSVNLGSIIRPNVLTDMMMLWHGKWKTQLLLGYGTRNSDATSRHAMNQWKYRRGTVFSVDPSRWLRHSTRKELWEAAFSVGSVLRLYHEDQRDKPVSREPGGVEQLAVRRQIRRTSSREVAPGGGGEASTVISRCAAMPNSFVAQAPASGDRSSGTRKLMNLRRWKQLSGDNRWRLSAWCIEL
jgi:hypothetical protein